MSLQTLSSPKHASRNKNVTAPRCAPRGVRAAVHRPHVGKRSRNVAMRVVSEAVAAPSPSEVASGGLEVYTSVGRTARPRVVVLGSGWGAMSFVKSLPRDIANKYDVVVCSPRNYFLYTPLLPAVATGTCEDRSIVEPVRKLLGKKGEYYEALCKSIDVQRKELVACFPKDAGFDEACFKIEYDILVMAVGSVNNTFGIKGVKDYCMFFKTIEDANALRRRVSECFERAALPACPPEEKKKLLSFVIVGGGPTGVEVAAELYDMVHENMSSLYPNIVSDVNIQIVELTDHVLSTYDRKISEYTASQFGRTGVKLVLNTRVQGVRDGYVEVVDKEGNVLDLPFGACVWATGIAKNPLVQQLQEQLPEQNHFRSILTDETLCVKGSKGSIYALGDAATIEQPKALEHVEELFDIADVNKDSKVSLAELRDMLKRASKEFSHLEEHARFLDQSGSKRWGGMVRKTVHDKSGKSNGGALAEITEETELSKEEFAELLGKIDKGLRALPATAQVAAQQGGYLAGFFAGNKLTGEQATTSISRAAPFRYFHKGSLAYIGRDIAVADMPTIGPLFGLGVGYLWKGYETLAQFSLRNQVLVATDWMRTKLFGRDVSRV